MKLLIVSLMLACAASAHRLDEYLQATLIGVTQKGVEVEISLTPGVAVLPVVMAAIDRDGDGRISADEERVYSARVAREVELRVDGERATLRMTESHFPAVEEMREGVGSIRVRLQTARAGREIQFENRHLPAVSVYLVNFLAAKGLGRPLRDEAQKSIQVEYLYAGLSPTLSRGTWWMAAVGMLLMIRVGWLRFR